MALSFLDSKKKISEKQAIKPVTLSEKIASDTLLSESFQTNSRYEWYNNYQDASLSTISADKNITVDSAQINMTQETNSQFIPFEMPRFYDGIDLNDMTIQIHYVNSEKREYFAVPVNVSYSDTKIRFAWLVDEYATALAGDITFEIIAIGINEKGQDYIWKTKPNGKINILKSLAGNGIIKPDDDWIIQFLKQINVKVSEAATHAQNAQAAATQAQQTVKQVQEVVDGAKNEILTSVETTIQDNIASALLPYYTKTEVDNLLANIDISDSLEEINQKIDSIDGLANFKVEYTPETNSLTFYNGASVIKNISLNTDPSVEWVAAYDEKVDDKISTAIAPFYTKEQTDEFLKDKASVSDIANLSTAIGVVESTANINKGNITVLGGKIAEIEESMSDIHTAPQKTYDATYDQEQIFTLWEIEGEGEGDSEVRTPKSQFKIQGGSGGSSTSSVLKIEYITKSPVTATINDKIIIQYIFSGTDSSGDIVSEGSATWKIGNTVIAKNIAINGENSFDITDFIVLGTQKVTLVIVDDAGSMVTKNWTIQKIDIRLESSFNDKLTYNIGDISFDYTPYGAISKDIHFILDEIELPKVTTASSGIPMAYTLPAKPHGSHRLEVYITAEINGNKIESNHIVKDIIWYDAASDVPVISCAQTRFVAKQYDITNIVFTVYDPHTENPTVILREDGQVISTLTLDNNTHVWQYKSTEVGEHTLTITCRDTVKTLTAIVEKLDIDLEPITAGLVFDFNPSGHSNNDENRLWTDGNVAMAVSDNFDWVNGGYQMDDNGDQYFCIKSGTSAIINYKLFEDDAKRNGKEFKFVFKTTNVRNGNSTFLRCVDGTDSSKVGIQMNIHKAYIYASADSLYLPYSEEDVIEFEFNITKNTEEIPMVMGYEDGVASRPLVYGESHNFTQINPQIITIGSEDCDVLIYRFKVYNTGLTDRGILNNFIADARSAEEMIARYKRNQIYDENNLLTPEILAERCPDLRIIKVDAPWFTNDKKNKVTGTTVQCINKGGDPVLDNWTAYNCQHSGQGTSSNEYGAAGRNIDLIMNKSGVEGADPYIILGDGTTQASKITLTRDSVPTNYLNVKVNIASSENANNALLQRRYNEYNPYVRPAKAENSKVKDTMEFVNCVLFVRENNPDISTHREFADCEYHFYAIGNIGDSKKTDSSRVNDKTDPLECILEIMDYNLPLSEFPAGEEALAILDADNFDEEGTYGWRYRVESDDPVEDASIVEAINEKWREFYRFVVNSTNEEFHKNLSNYFVVDSALYYYLFTERYTMVDNRAKNSFWHYSKCNDGVYRWDLCFDYDND